MRKIVFLINSSIDGFADHTSGIADDELHDLFTTLLKDVDVVLLGRKTYQLMESFWPIAHQDPRCTESMKRFADKYNPMKKIVFSTTLKNVEWQNSTLAVKDLITTVSELKKENGKNIAAGSLSIASQLLKNNLIDEFWFVVHPVIAGGGPRLLDGNNAKKLQLITTKKLKSGVIALNYRIKNSTTK